MNDKVMQAINSVSSGVQSFCKFLTGNDTGATGAHQSGIYMPKTAVPILFPESGIKGHNMKKYVNIHWQNDFLTENCIFSYYGKGTQNEYRITHFGRGFPFLRPEYTGALFILVQADQYDYRGFVLNTDEEIEDFLAAFNISPIETNRIIELQPPQIDTRENEIIQDFIARVGTDFPDSETMAAIARQIVDILHGHKEYTVSSPDQAIIDWTGIEYHLFRALEHTKYEPQIQHGFPNIDEFVNLANTVVNRRKSRAGRSFEHHLAALFDSNGILYTPQAITEGNKKPDFIFPSAAAYHDSSFSTQKLVSLAAKTTCKDRWRQVLNEADRLRNGTKFLCTLQQGISVQQMEEMAAEHVVLVVPKPYINTYPREKRNEIWTLHHFIDYIREIEEI